jgi:hypothetical protein
MQPRPTGRHARTERARAQPLLTCLREQNTNTSPFPFLIGLICIPHHLRFLCICYKASYRVNEQPHLARRPVKAMGLVGAVTATDPRVGDTLGGATGTDSTIRDVISGLSITSDDETLIEDANPYKADTIVLEDWSETGRGSHVDFAHDENVPLEQGE